MWRAFVWFGFGLCYPCPLVITSEEGATIDLTDFKLEHSRAAEKSAALKEKRGPYVEAP